MTRHGDRLWSLAARSPIDGATRNGRGARDGTSDGRLGPAESRGARRAGWRSWTAEPGAVSRAAVQVGHRAPGTLAVQRREMCETIELVLAGELDLATRELVRDALMEVGEPAPQRLVLDLSGLTFIDVSGLHVLLAAAERCRASAAPTLKLVPGPPPVHEVFEITGLADRLPFTASSGPRLSVCAVQGHLPLGTQLFSQPGGDQPSQRRRIGVDISGNDEGARQVVGG